MTWSCDGRGDGTAGLRLAGALHGFWWIRGYLIEGGEWLGRLLAAVPRNEAPAPRAYALYAAGTLAWGLGQFESNRAFHEESLTICREIGDRHLEARCLIGLGQRSYAKGDEHPAVAREYYEAALAIARSIGDRRSIAVALNGLGNAASVVACDYESAETHYREALDIFREIGDRLGVSYALVGLGNVAFAVGDYAAARAWHEEGVRAESALGNRRDLADSLDGLGNVAFAARQDARAACLWGAAERIHEEIGSPIIPAWRRDHARRVAAARARLADDGSFDSAWREGRAMTLDAIVAYALGKRCDGA
jgi:tetratricopeptide (TPR) repeat protein